MSSQVLENRNLEKLLPQDRLLFLLKMRGPQTAAELAKSLRISSEAVRQQLTRLEGESLVSGKAEVRGVGRPVQLYQLDQRDQRSPGGRCPRSIDSGA
jgi:predicted ArsR family transcriptional regulator